MHRWLFVGLAIMAAVGGVGTALVSGQRVQNPSLGLELIAMVEESSAAGYVVRFDPTGGPTRGRPSIPSPEEIEESFKTAEELVAEHTKRLREIVAEFGWPGKQLVGHDGAHAAWELLQRAPDDFQEQALALMQKLPRGQVDPHDLAVLTDRVAVKSGKPQTYGTQLFCDTSTGEIKIEGGVAERERIDQQRAEAGLPPLNEELDDAFFRFGACERG